MSAFKQKTLWDRVSATASRAMRCGALEPIPTEFQFMEDRGVRFLVRVVAKLARKPRAPLRAYDDPVCPNPFLPYEPPLYVADASDTHVCILNKYNVVDRHLLIVTRRFEHQESPLNADDFLALWRCLLEYDSLGFYNSGTAAGASQPHKHLQLVPLPLAPDGPPIPLECLLEADRPHLASQGGESRGGPVRLNDAEVGSARRIPFAHALAYWNGPIRSDAEAAAGTTFGCYRLMLKRLGLACTGGAEPRVSAPYNLLVTRHWMLLVPRRTECFHTISLNALAFAGALLARTENELELLKSAGPFAALKTVTYPR